MEADDQQQPKPCRFHVANDEEISNILLAKDSINTNRSTKAAAKCFRDFLTETSRSPYFESYQNTFKISSDDTGRRFVYQDVDELDKNHRGKQSSSSVTEDRIYENPDSEYCPVKSFEKYLAKLHPKRNDLWQRPNDSFSPEDEYWYYESPVGKNLLAGFMTQISKMGKLSHMYKNHSIRASSITILDRSGISGRHIMKISGHQSETSLKSYSHHVSDSKKREISDTFSKQLNSEAKEPKVDTKRATYTVARPVEEPHLQWRGRLRSHIYSGEAG